MNEAGEIVGAYRLVRTLGRGGMGEVWLGEHEQIGSKVAIKLVLGDPRDREAGARFLREAKATARVRHPNIVAVSDYGARTGGGAYLVMELLDGRTLAERKKPLAVELALDIATQTADALGAAHAAGVVHRDLKPNNIFLVDDPAARHGVRVKLLDFGIAKAPETDLGMTATGQLIGTPLYMAPEQCATRLGTIDHRTDLYALGVVLYELVTGAPPFPGPTLGDLVDQHVNATPEPPRAKAPAVPARLEALITSLLAKQKTDRPASALEVARTLREISGGSREHVVVSAHSPTMPSTMQPVAAVSIVAKPSRARWIALAIALVAGGIAVLLHVTRGDPPVDITKLDGPGLERACRDHHAGACFTLARTEHQTQPTPSLSRVFSNYQAACDLGHVESCAHVAWMHAWGAGVRSDHARARALADRACTAGTPLGCDIAGDLASSGLGGAHDIHVATAYYKRGCELGGPDPCTSLGRMLTLGVGELRDEVAGRAALERALDIGTKRCTANDGAGCRVAGLAHMRGVVTTKDAARGATLIARGCELGSAEACNDAGQLYAIGIGVAKDPATTERLLKLGCDRGYATACAVHGIAIANGMAGPIDLARAHALAREACDRGDRNCVVLGNFYSTGVGVERDPKIALVHYERGCAAGDPEACAQAASTRIPGVERDPKRSEELLARSCALGSAFGCATLGKSEAAREEFAKARTSFERSCALSDGESGCTDLAALYLDGQGVPANPAKGRALLDKGCATNDMVACDALGRRLRDGTGLPANAAEALSLLEKSCTLGWGRGCLDASAMLTTSSHGLTLDAARAETLRARGCELEPSRCKDHSSRSRSESAPQ